MDVDEFDEHVTDYLEYDDKFPTLDDKLLREVFTDDAYQKLLLQRAKIYVDEHYLGMTSYELAAYRQAGRIETLADGWTALKMYRHCLTIELQTTRIVWLDDEDSEETRFVLSAEGQPILKLVAIHRFESERLDGQRLYVHLNNEFSTEHFEWYNPDLRVSLPRGRAKWAAQLSKLLFVWSELGGHRGIIHPSRIPADWIGSE
jgi:hypothetical protein